MHRSCLQCGTSFEITDEDLAFLEKVSPVFAGKKELIPPPTLCPLCRTQRRMAWRNHQYVYRNPSPNHTSAGFSMWPANSPFPAYENSHWFSDQWDQHASAQDIDVVAPFFPQFLAVHDNSPHFALDTIRMENSEYSNNADDLKNCYLCFNCSNSEDCIACDTTNFSRDCLDCTRVFHGERCYQCMDCERCYEAQHCRSCENCSNSTFLLYCRSCSNCLGCVNIRHREYCVFNEQKTPQEYADIVRSMALDTRSGRLAFAEQFRTFALQHPVPHAVMRMADGCTGNYLAHCDDVQDCMFVHSAEHLRNCQYLFEGVDNCRDLTLFGVRASHCYEGSIMGLDAYQSHFCVSVWEGTSNMLYCAFCVACSDCFGCTGLHRKRYCILNRQYSKEEYEDLVPRIITHMRETGEWGEFFPISGSPVPYNRSLAHMHFPLDRSTAVERGYAWHDEVSPSDVVQQTEHTETIPADNTPVVLRSTASDRLYRLTAAEIAAYRSFQAPLPRTTYDERIQERSTALGGIKLYDRTCAKTGKPIKTTIPPESPWIVWDREEWENEFGS